VSNVPPPLLGFNNNVRHRGRIFHIQTEDSGVKNPRIVTHLFADGGRIIKTTRTEYAEHVSRPDMQPFVRGLMKEQHKGMFTALRLGDLDQLLENLCGPFEQPLQASKAPPASSPSLSSSTLVAAARVEPIVTERAPSPAPSQPPPRVPALDANEASLERLPRNLPPPSNRSSELGDLLAQGSPELRKVHTPPAVAPSNLSRPSSRFAAAPSKSASSIFGDGVISEQSLDEVILSYLAEDLDGSSE